MAQSREVFFSAALVVAGALFLSVAGSVSAQQLAAAPSSQVPPSSPPTVHTPVLPGPAAVALFQQLQSRAELSMFYDALTQSRINLTLGSLVDSQPVTVFAPNNGAFGMLSPQLKACLNTSSGKLDVLTQVMMYHIAIGGSFTAQQLANMTQVRSVSGMPIELATTQSGLVVEGSARIVSPDAISSVNATVHVMDDIIFPDSIIPNVMIECYGVPASQSLPLPLPSAGSF